MDSMTTLHPAIHISYWHLVLGQISNDLLRKCVEHARSYSYVAWRIDRARGFFTVRVSVPRTYIMVRRTLHLNGSSLAVQHFAFLLVSRVLYVANAHS
eukprot:sb/3478912/